MDGGEGKRRLEGKMEKLSGELAGGWRWVRTEGKVKRLMEAMVKIVRDVDKAGVKVTATLDSRVQG